MMTEHANDHEDPAEWTQAVIREYCRDSPENIMFPGGNEPMFDEPLVGFSSAGDPLYDLLRKDIGDPFMKPDELFRASFPDTDTDAGDLTVISWILPQTRRTKDDSRSGTAFAPERWARTRLFGDRFNLSLMRHVTGALGAKGIPAVAPQLSSSYTQGLSAKYGMAASWSERHAAYVSGLGTFGLCDGLITRAGKAMRCGSVIARIAVPPTPRTYTGHHDWCLFFARGSCGVCRKRCPAGAITDTGHDKLRCREYLFGRTKPYIQEKYGIDIYACGLCQTGTPCESKNPVRE